MKFRIKPSWVLLTVFLLSIFFSVQVFAGDNILKQKQDAKKKGNNQESWLDEAMSSNFTSSLNAMIGEVPDEILNGNPTSMLFIPSGAVGTMNNMIAALQTPTASGIEYIASLKDNILGKPAYAQGVGFQKLQPILPLWRGFRNIVYTLSSIAFIMIGVLIILRVKISPQAVISIQNAIPQLITTLILVTFSYAIAGLMIDVSNFFQAAAVALFFNMKGIPLNENLFSLQWGSGFPLISDLGNLVQQIYREVGQWAGIQHPFEYGVISNPDFNTFNLLAFRAGPNWISLLMLGALVGSILTGTFLGGFGNTVLGGTAQDVLNGVGGIVGGVLGGAIGGIIIPLFFSIVIAIWMIKLYFGMIKVYVTIIFKIILAPLEIGMGAFPGAKMGFSSWIWDLIANLAVFPIINIFLIILNMIMDSFYTGGLIWAPNPINIGGDVSPLVLAACVGFAGLSMVSKLPDLIPQVIFSIKPSPFGSAVGDTTKWVDPMTAGLAWQGADRGFGAVANSENTKATEFLQKRLPFGLGKRIESTTLATRAEQAQGAVRMLGGILGHKFKD